MKVLIWLVLLSATANADQGIMVMPSRQVNLNDVNYNGQSVNSAMFEVRMRASCFGTNLRSVKNPLSPNSNIVMNVGLKRSDGAVGSVSLKFSAQVAAPGSGLSPGAITPVTVTGFSFTPTAEGAGGTVSIKVPGIIGAGGKAFDLEGLTPGGPSIVFEQTDAASSGQYMGSNGPLSASVSYAFASDNSMVDISAAFPGQQGFCGGFFSPLMIFFSDRRPAFSNVVPFKLSEFGETFYWPEASTEWAFLALDRNGNGKIDSGEELFGEGGRSKNGFEALGQFDSNHDGVIDTNDDQFSKLVLWFDKNGNGISEKVEIQPLSVKGITKIDLKYDANRLTPLGRRAEFRERSKVHAGLRKYDIIDIWLGIHKASMQK